MIMRDVIRVQLDYVSFVNSVRDLSELSIPVE